MATEYLKDKIQMLQQQLRQGSLEVFNNQLTAQDAENLPGDKVADATLKAAAETARQRVIIWSHKNALRRKLLEELEKEQAAALAAEKPEQAQG